MSRLSDKINSDYFKSSNSLNKSRGKIITVFVENEDDIPFWKDIFNKNNLFTKIFPASRTSLNRGKTEVLKKADKVGEFLILCVDSDYDYLLQTRSEISKKINTNPYIFQTYTYSIENYKCYSKSLSNVMLMATLEDDEQLFNYEIFLKKYSSIVFELFIYSLHNEKIKSKKFTIDNFSDTIKLLRQVDLQTDGKNSLNLLKRNVESKIKTLPKLTNENLQEYKNIIKKLGVTSENTYLFIRGHTIYDNVVSMFLKPIENHLKSKHYKKIDLLKKDTEEASNKRNQYKKEITDFESILRSHTNYYDCFLMEKIFKDVKKYKNSYN